MVLVFVIPKNISMNSVMIVVLWDDNGKAYLLEVPGDIY